MAPRSSLVYCLVYLVALCLVQIEEAASSGCRRTGHGGFGTEAAVSPERQNRKMLAASFKEKNKQAVVGVKSNELYEEAAARAGVSVDGKHHLVGWELRKAPSGPDPLHHNGNTPQKPRIDP